MFDGAVPDILATMVKALPDAQPERFTISWITVEISGDVFVPKEIAVVHEADAVVSVALLISVAELGLLVLSEAIA